LIRVRSEASITAFTSSPEAKLSLYDDDMVQMMALCFGGVANFELCACQRRYTLYRPT
jgi:hypothetical protein